VAQQAGPLLAPKIDDWCAMFDSVMIDPAYDGQVFKVALADVPERKDEPLMGSSRTYSQGPLGRHFTGGSTRSVLQHGSDIGGAELV
jgi:hypothetical protein